MEQMCPSQISGPAKISGEQWEHLRKAAGIGIEVDRINHSIILFYSLYFTMFVAFTISLVANR